LGLWGEEAREGKARAMENQKPQGTLTANGFFTSPIRYHIPLKLFTSGTWSGLTAPARGVLPVIAVHANKEEPAFPGMKIISEWSGYKKLEKVKEGIDFLRAMRLIEKEQVGRHNQYYIKGKALFRGGTYFPMWKNMFEAGVWSELVPSEQALWPLLGVKASMSYYGIDEREPFEHGTQRFRPNKLLRMFGMSRDRFYSALKSLCQKGLISFSSDYPEKVVEYNPCVEYAGNEYTTYYLPTRLREKG